MSASDPKRTSDSQFCCDAQQLQSSVIGCRPVASEANEATGIHHAFRRHDRLAPKAQES